MKSTHINEPSWTGHELGTAQPQLVVNISMNLVHRFAYCFMSVFAGGNTLDLDQIPPSCHLLEQLAP